MSGTWTSQNKVLPGAYINFKSNKPLAITPGDRGIVSLPLVLGWGEKGKIYEVFGDSNTLETLGFSKQEIIPLREALKGATKALVYKVNGGTKASTLLAENLTATAVCEGTRGNDLSVKVRANQKESSKWDVITLLEGVEVDLQVVGTPAEFKGNPWIKLSGEGVAFVAITAPLAGGTNTDPTTTDYEDYLEAMKTQFFNAIGYTGDTLAVKNAIADFVKVQREEEGNKVQAVMANMKADYEGIISVANGVVLEDGTKLSAAEACAWVAGKTAGAKINQSNTNTTYKGAIDVVPRMTKTEKEEAVNNGQFIFTVNSNQDVTAIYDINSLVTYTVEKSKDFRKNRVIRTLDNVNNDITTIYETNYMGKVDNNDEGRSLLRMSLIEYFKELERLRGIQNFTPEDVVISAGTDKDAVLIQVYIQPVDSAEKFYMTVNVR